MGDTVDPIFFRARARDLQLTDVLFKTAFKTFNEMTPLYIFYLPVYSYTLLLSLVN